MGARRQARVQALQILFQWDIHARPDTWLEDFWAQREVPESVRTFTEALVEGVRSNQAELDRLIQAAATNWTIARMPIVDRNILRLSLYELLWMPDVPAKVTLNEAIELAKAFADDEAKGFINGVLDRLLREDPRLDHKRAELAEAGREHP